MTATVTMSDGSTKTATGTWGSDNTSVATVNQSGLVTGITPGAATIYCDEGGLRGTKTLTVQTPTATAVTVTSPNSTIWVGQTEWMTATVTMSDGSTKTATGTWGSDNTSVATVNQSGLVTGVGAGNATIYIDTIGNQSGVVAGISPGDVTFTGLRGTKRLTVRSPWSRSGVGDMVFDMPTYVSRVRVVGTYTGYSSNFIVYVAGRLFVNELLGTGWNTTRYDGTLLTTGGVVEVKHSSGVSWSFTQVPTTTAIMNTTRKITNIPSKSDSRNREYEIYKRVAAEIK
ncbi:Ig-like domain-containing protein [Acidobacteriota bacterium]